MLINNLEKYPENLTESYLKIDDIVQDEETAPVENELDDDTGETILHHLAKEGCIEALTKILDLEETPKINQSKLVEAIIHLDNSGWSPLMAAMKSERNVNEVLDLFLKFLEKHATSEDVDKLTKENPKVRFFIFKGRKRLYFLNQKHGCSMMKFENSFLEPSYW